MLPREIVRRIMKMRALIIVRKVSWRRFTSDPESAAQFNKLRISANTFSFDRSTWTRTNEQVAEIIRSRMYAEWMDAWNNFPLYKRTHKKTKIK